MIHPYSTLDREVFIILKYLVKSRPTGEFAKKYAKAVKKLAVPFSEKEKRVWAVINKHPMFLPYIDAFLGIFNPFSGIRQRVFIATALLEATPELSDSFLPKRITYLSLIKIYFLSMISGHRIIMGFVIYRLI